MSARLWTSGYDIFSPTQSLLGHHYVRNHKPKFWESIHRTFSFGVHNPLQMLVLNRVKYQVGNDSSRVSLDQYNTHKFDSWDIPSRQEI